MFLRQQCDKSKQVEFLRKKKAKTYEIVIFEGGLPNKLE